MRVVIAPDKFKGCLSAPEVARAIALGVLRAAPDASIDEAPMADGGEGTVDALVAATGGSTYVATVSGPLGEPVVARFGLLGDLTTAVVEMATASGLVLVPPDRRDPAAASTRGTGELILAALAAGAGRVIVGIGGSATNDGGAGLAQSFGFRLLDSAGRDLPPGGGPLAKLDRIERPPRDESGPLHNVRFSVACDVDNPLCGPRGASAVYGPQKGAGPALVAELDENLERLARVVARDLDVSIRDLPGAGAAGGLGGGLVAFAGATLMPGAGLVIEAVGLGGRLAGADLCLTGEGSLDGSSAFGKTCVGVARLARSLGCPTLALAGTIGEGAEDVLGEGVDAYFPICPGPMSLDESIRRAPELLGRAAEQAVRGFLAGRARAGR